jgi:predicted ABC-type sugar transport system permease subunit
MNTRQKLGLGSVFATFGALGIVLSMMLEWTALPRPWGFLLGFILGVATGLGVLLSIKGLLEHRRQI